MPKVLKARKPLKKRKVAKVAFVPVIVPRDAVETYIHEDSLEWLERRAKPLCHSIYGPFKRTA